MIGVYVEGSKTKGLGHLSRIIAIYSELKKYHEIQIYFYGDEIGKAYLEKFALPYLSCDDPNFEVLNHQNWLIDSTTLSSNQITKKLSLAKKVVLLSPKFDKKFIDLIDIALIRSDPFDLEVKEKVVDPRFFVYGTSNHGTSKMDIGVVLSGTDVKKEIRDIVNLCLETESIAQNINSITAFLGSSQSIDFQKLKGYSYKVDLLFISALGNVWKYLDNADLVVVGNGIVVEEALEEHKRCIVFMNSQTNNILKINSKFIDQIKVTRNIKELEEVLVEEVKATKGSYSLQNDNNNPSYLTDFLLNYLNVNNV